MNKAESEISGDDLRPEYDFSKLRGRVRGKYVERYHEETDIDKKEVDEDEKQSVERAGY